MGPVWRPGRTPAEVVETTDASRRAWRILRRRRPRPPDTRPGADAPGEPVAATPPPQGPSRAAPRVRHQRPPRRKSLRPLHRKVRMHFLLRTSGTSQRPFRTPFATSFRPSAFFPGSLGYPGPRPLRGPRGRREGLRVRLPSRPGPRTPNGPWYLILLRSKRTSCTLPSLGLRTSSVVFCTDAFGGPSTYSRD